MRLTLKGISRGHHELYSRSQIWIRLHGRDTFLFFYNPLFCSSKSLQIRCFVLDNRNRSFCERYIALDAAIYCFRCVSGIQATFDATVGIFSLAGNAVDNARTSSPVRFCYAFYFDNSSHKELLGEGGG